MGIFGRLQDYLQDAAMDQILRRKIIYNVAWEDPRIDGKVLGLGEGETILMLTTGGCNVLDRLLDGVAHIVSVDLNHAQNGLLELRLAAAQACTHEQFFQLFAHSNRRLFDALYKPSLRPLLSPAAAAFWDQNASFFDDAMYAGASGGLARILTSLVWLFGLQPLIRSFLTCRNVEEQRALLDQPENKRTVDRLIWTFDTLLPVFCPFAGVPASQLRLITGADGDAPADAPSIVRTFIDRIFRKTHIASDNYFYYGYLFGKYSRTCCPRYLRPENFAALKAAAGRVTVRTKLLHEAAEEYPDGYFSSMILLDHMDWLSQEQIQQEWAVFSKKLNPSTGRILWRSFSYEQRWSMLKFLHFNKETVDAAEAAMPDRVGMYNSCHLANIPPRLAICAPKAAQPASAAAVRADRAAILNGLLVVISLVPLLGAWLAAVLRAMVGLVLEPKAKVASDEGTAALLSILPGMSNGTWVDVGAGMAPLLREGGDNVDMYTGGVHVVHFHAAAAAQQQEEAPSSWGAVAVTEHVVTGSANTTSAIDTVGVAKGTADVVTVCHGLVAEADWDARLQMATALLKPGGILAVCDLASPAPPSTASYSVLRRTSEALRAALWSGAHPRSAAPHRVAVEAKLRELTTPVHAEERPAGWAVPAALLGKPLPSAHFAYVGKKA